MSVINKVGKSPGTLLHVGERKAHALRIRVMDYDPSGLQELEVTNIEDCFPFRSTASVTWINIDGLHEVELFDALGRHFDIHPLTLEDILNTHQRPKLEEFEDYLFLIMRMLSQRDGVLQDEQLSVILGRNFVISFQEREGDVLDPLRERIRNGKGRIRRLGPDYLAYALVDVLVDNYFLVLEGMGDQIEHLEDSLVLNPTPEQMEQIYAMRTRMILLRKSVWPLREVISRLERIDSDLIQETTSVFLRDVYDHTIQVIDTIETYRDMTSGMLDLYLSSVSNRMNEIMKVLTIIGSIFIPLTFVAGIYGMNFDNMPELKTEYGYYITIGAMVVVAVSMFLYFRRKKWI